MVERLKEAIERARRERGSASAADLAHAGARAAPVAQDSAPATSDIPAAMLDPDHLRRERIVAYDCADPSHVAFNALRTRISQVCAKNGWRNIGVASPRKGSGKSTVAVNLALSLARGGDRVLLVDLDLKAPRLAYLLGGGETFDLPATLGGAAPADSVLRTAAPTLVVALNSRRVRHSAELILAPGAEQAIEAMRAAANATLVLFDLPPVLEVDDTLAFAPRLDAILLVAAAEETSAEEIETCERMLGESPAFLGVVFNKVGAHAGGYGAYASGY